MLCFGLEIVRKLALVEWKIGPRGGPTWAPGAFRRALVRHVGRRGRWEAKFGQLWGRSWAHKTIVIKSLGFLAEAC